MFTKIGLISTAGALAFSAAAWAGPNDGGAAPVPADATGALLPNYGHIMCTAAINSTGTVAGGFLVNRDVTKTGKVTGFTGAYQVSFAYPCVNITAARGWSRFVQVDTLATGQINGVSCTTADRSGDVNGVFVQCTDGTGNPVDTSFFLNVMK